MVGESRGCGCGCIPRRRNTSKQKQSGEKKATIVLGYEWTFSYTPLGIVEGTYVARE